MHIKILLLLGQENTILFSLFFSPSMKQVINKIIKSYRHSYHKYNIYRRGNIIDVKIYN